MSFFFCDQIGIRTIGTITDVINIPPLLALVSNVDVIDDFACLVFDAEFLGDNDDDNDHELAIVTKLKSPNIYKQAVPYSLKQQNIITRKFVTFQPSLYILQNQHFRELILYIIEKYLIY